MRESYHDNKHRMNDSNTTVKIVILVTVRVYMKQMATKNDNKPLSEVAKIMIFRKTNNETI